MTEPRLLLCTDMDRTVIPNGHQKESPAARASFRSFCTDPSVTLVYVTGRDMALVEQAITQYRLPVPDYVISDVGTKIYHRENASWQSLERWEREIDVDWNGWTHSRLRDLLHGFTELKLQEKEKQNTHKLSYYVELGVEIGTLLGKLDSTLEAHGVSASLIWSIDEPENIGLLDILPRNATKLHGVEFLRQMLGYSLNEMVFAGDSGNDLPVLASPIPSVLVANASDDVKRAALDEAKACGHESALYLANGSSLGMNGNYTAGVLEGVWHYQPAYRPILEQRQQL